MSAARYHVLQQQAPNALAPTATPGRHAELVQVVC
jgi:hypothetical protein